MEMEYHDTSRRGRVLIVLGVILAVAAGAGAFFVLNNQQQSTAPTSVQRKPAVVATRAITARKAIEAGDVVVSQVAIDPTNAAGVIADLTKVIGRIPAVSILAGQLVTENLFASANAGLPFSILGPTETVSPSSEPWRAISMTVPADRAVGGYLTVGQTVDVFVTASIVVPADIAAQNRYYSDQSTKVVYQNMVILARTGDQYVVRATLAVAEEINHLLAGASTLFSMALRPDIDVRLVDATTLGETTTKIIAKYGLPVPEIYPQGLKVGPTLPPRVP